ncbi:MAG TPA: peptidylprolyl isomerase [Bdellovibrionales bacterium]|nr:peptidylprolyl isomerase [Bdellovibrionales bacterium]
MLFIILVYTATPAFSQDVVATIGDQKITLEEFNKRYNEVRSLVPNPPPKEVFLEDLIRYKLGLLEADKKKIKDDPIVQERVRQEIYKGLLEKELGEKINAIKVSENDMQSFYKTNPEVRTSHILVEIKPGANAEERAAARKRATEILSEVKSSKKPFEELVNLYTDDVSTKTVGGDIGWQTRVTVAPAYYESALKLKLGEVSSLVETEFGFHIIKLTGRNSYQKANKRKLRAAVFDEKKKEVFDKYFGQLKSAYKIQVNKSALR